MLMIRHCDQAYPRSGVPPSRRTCGAPESGAVPFPRRPGTAAVTSATGAVTAAVVSGAQRVAVVTSAACRAAEVSSP